MSFSGEHFTVGQVLCDNVTGDHGRGMIALYECCTITAPTPLGVFEGVGGKWKLVYSLVGRLVYNIKIQGRDLIEETPVYSRSNPLCLPVALPAVPAALEWSTFRHDHGPPDPWVRAVSLTMQLPGAGVPTTAFGGQATNILKICPVTSCAAT